MLRIPDVVREKALAAGASAWLETLPQLVAALEQQWEITVGRPYRDSTEAFVAEAVCKDGMPAVLKVIVPRDAEAAAHEIAVLRLTDGEGCVRLLRDDVTRGALLLERLGRPLHELGLPLRRRHEILVAAASRVWRRTAADYGFPTGATKARWWRSSSPRCGRSSTVRAPNAPSIMHSLVRRGGTMRIAKRRPCS